MSISFIITGKEILELPNNYDLGYYVREKYNKINDQYKSYVSSDGYDLCVICGKKTEYTYDIHIDNRIGYVEGVGQTCPDKNKCKIKTN